MCRQLYFLLPDTLQTQALCDDLSRMKIERKDLHAIVPDDTDSSESQGLQRYCDVKPSNRVDKDYYLEWVLWRANLLVFAVSLVFFVAALINDNGGQAFIALVMMLATFSAGYYFVWRMPNVHWRDCLQAIKHGEILLIVDLPKHKLHSIDRIVHRRHPEAIGAGVGWKL